MTIQMADIWCEITCRKGENCPITGQSQLNGPRLGRIVDTSKMEKNEMRGEAKDMRREEHKEKEREKI